MSEQQENTANDLGDYSLDDEDQLQPEDTLEQDDVDDVLDRGYSPPDRLHGSLAHGVTAEPTTARVGQGLEVAWRGRYERLPEGARLTLRLPATGVGGFVVEQGRISGSVIAGKRSWRIVGVVRNAAAVDRVLAVPAASVPVSCLVDGRPVAARVKPEKEGAALVFPAPLARGAHRVEFELEETAPASQVGWPEFQESSLT